MKQFLLLIVLMSTGSLAVRAQDKNLVFDANAQVRKVSGFNGVEISGAIDLYLSQGAEEAVAISASADEIASSIRTEVKGETLHIYFDGKGFGWRGWGNHKMKAYVTFKTIDHIEASGACNVKITDPVKLSDLKIEMSGASDFSGPVTVANLHLEASGASKIKVSGTAEKTLINTSGASGVSAYELKTDKCKMDASGASVIRITVNKEFVADASGGSSIYYKGTGMIRDVNSSGGATIKRKSDD
jgi:hypothetical protein